MEPVPFWVHFKTVQPVADETRIRSVAYDEIKALDNKTFTALKEVCVSTPEIYFDFLNLLNNQTARNPQRAKNYLRSIEVR